MWAQASWDEGFGKNMVATIPLPWVDQVEKVMWWPKKDVSKIIGKYDIPGKGWLKYMYVVCNCFLSAYLNLKVLLLEICYLAIKIYTLDQLPHLFFF